MTDKAVSTEDLCIDVPRNASLEAARLEAVIKTLIENKVETLKNAKRKSSSITSSPKSLFNKLRGNSTSTVSSKEKDEIVSIHSQVSKQYDVGRRREGRRAAKSEHRKRKSSPRHVRTSPKLHQRTLQFSDEDGNENFGFFHKEPTTECSESCCCQQNPNEIQIHVDEDFISLNLQDYDNLNPEEIVAMKTGKRVQRKKRRRRKHHRKHLKMTAVAVQVNDLKELDEDELSQRARMTIVLTAFLLLFMCLLLVGITLRMAPLIDDMGLLITHLHNPHLPVPPHSSTMSVPPLDFPEIDYLIDDVPTTLPKKPISSSLDDIRAWTSSPPRRHHRHSCQFESGRRKSTSSNRRSSVASTRRHRNSTTKRWLPPEVKASEKKRRRTVYIVGGMFLFILFSCVLVVIVTLTHQTEGKRNSTYYTYAPPPPEIVEKTTSREDVGERLEYVVVRKENEELMNSLVEDSTSHDSLHNLTASVPDSLK